MNKEYRGILQMVLCATLWSIAGIFMKFLPWNGFAVASIRSFFAGATIAVFMALSRYRFQLTKRTLISGILSGSVYVCFSLANKLTTAANAIVLQFTSPAFVVLFSAVLYHTKIRKSDIAVVLIVLAGIALFFLDQLSPGNMLGNVFGIFAGVFLAQMFVMVGRGGDDDSTRMSGILIAHILTLLIGLPIGIPLTTEVAGIEILYVIILGVFQLGIPYVLYGIASRDCSPLACSLIGMLEPLLNPVWVAIFIGETPGPFALVGAVIIIGTVTWWCVRNR